MKLIIAIVHNDYAARVVKRLTQKKYRITRLSSTGGFLKSGNTTLLAGVENDRVNDFIKNIEEECKECKSKRGDKMDAGKANIFVLDMAGHKKL